MHSSVCIFKAQLSCILHDLSLNIQIWLLQAISIPNSINNYTNDEFNYSKIHFIRNPFCPNLGGSFSILPICFRQTICSKEYSINHNLCQIHILYLHLKSSHHVCVLHGSVQESGDENGFGIFVRVIAIKQWFVVVECYRELGSIELELS
ncbi:hypothetical protein Droror1_Dr00002460 [Drosera rotundifolia]